MIVAVNEFVKRQTKLSGKTYSEELSFDFFARHAEQKIINKDFRQGYRPEVIIVKLDKKYVNKVICPYVRITKNTKLSANFVKKIQDNSPIEIAAFTTILAMFLAFPIFILNFISLTNFEKQLLLNISFESFLSATVLGIVCTGFAILIFFNLIKIKSAVFASQSNFLIPCFGSLWGYIFLDENLTENMIYGLLLIVIGGWVTNRSMFVKSN